MNAHSRILQTILAITLTLGLIGSAKAESKLNTNLVVVQNVANDGLSFVIRKGRQDNIVKGQNSLFSSRNISFTARAISISSEYSQWIVNDNKIKVPFEKGQIITVNYSPERVWLEIPKIMGDKKYQQMLAKEEASLKERQYQKYDNRFELFYAKYQGLSESTTDSSNNDGTRVSDSFRLNYAIPINQMFQSILGARYDVDLLTLLNPNVEQETRRMLATAGLKINFSNDWSYRFSYFVQLSAGFGRSETLIQNTARTGTALVLPSVGLGLEYKVSTSQSLIFKLNFDAIQANEAYADGFEQSTDLTMLGLSVGYAF
ncbi:hypothetical protein [Halobacteriovorax sp. BALOs_7]|uniref:hypothetical protein n=1 Tax=Halobacteriovorax sp. BALOs_7 TaxID=2109558 RepID=UPI0013C4D4E2|nr:hypothetical protein [Halobacteriovorax sp. BALOs_7]